MTIRISDQGGGIPRSEVDLIWTYMHSTFKHPSLDTLSGSSMGSMGVAGKMLANPTNTSAIAGFGVGLPLSRLYSRYFGGNLEIKSLEGYGTDAFLHLNRLGEKCEG